MEWKPIETAPNDETPILVCRLPDDEHEYEPEILWGSSAKATGYFTHWMPLPHPPKEK